MTEQTNTLRLPGEFDAMVKLRPDEPYFLLLGRDRLAPELVCDWADRNRRKAFRERNEGLIDEAKLDAELRQSTDAEKISWSMKSYKEGQDRDAATGQKALAYTGHELPDEAAKRDHAQRATSCSLTAIHNAIAELTDAIPALRDVGRINDVEAIEATLAVLKSTADLITPKRPGIEKAAA